MLEINDTGLRIERLDEIIERLSTDYRSIYGSDVNLDPDTMDGQWVGILAQREADYQEAFAGMYAMSDPSAARGIWLDVQAKYVGITRNRPTRTILDSVEIVADVGSVIPEKLQFEDRNRNLWETMTRIQVTRSPVIVPMQSVLAGSFPLGANEVLQPKRVVLGLSPALNKKQAILGKVSESDAEFRVRFMRSYHINNCNDAEGVVASILGLPDVFDAKVYENITSAIDSSGVNPHTTNYVVAGGGDEDIALTIASKKTAGTGLQGNTPVTVFLFGVDRLITFDRPTAIDVSVEITVKRNSASVDIDQESIKDKISSKKFFINEDVVSGELYCISGSPLYKVINIKLSSGSTVGADVITVGLRELAKISKENVIVSIV